MMPTPFVLTDAGYQTNNKTNTKTIENTIVALPLFPQKKRIIIATDTAKVR
jgi:hypothetical protein